MGAELLKYPAPDAQIQQLDQRKERLMANSVGLTNCLTDVGTSELH